MKPKESETCRKINRVQMAREKAKQDWIGVKYNGCMNGDVIYGPSNASR